MPNTGAKLENLCLSDDILKKPDLLNNLLSVLLKFGEERYGIMSDIQEMFYQALTNCDDQQALRFMFLAKPTHHVGLNGY